LNLPYFISKRINTTDKKSFSSTIHKIAIFSIGLGLAIMILSFLILRGFQSTVKEKIYSFSSHFIITQYFGASSFEEPPMNINTAFYNNYEKYGMVDHVQEYIHKAGLIKTEDEILGIVFKGVGRSYDVDRINEFIIDGRFIEFEDSTYSKEVMLSKVIADKLDIWTGDEIIIHFFQDPPRSRKLKISGIYETNLTEYFDEKIILGDIDLLRRLNNWNDSIAGGLEIFVKDIEQVDAAEMMLVGALEYNQGLERVSDKYIQIFEWLHLIRRQVNIFLVIILFVVCVNMISIILILIMERTNMIGTLKALGATNHLIRKIFSFSGMSLVLKGLLLGNVLGIGLCYLQDKFKWIKLDPDEYYMSYVPIGWDLDIIIVLNVLTFTVITLVLFLPTAIISGIRPIQAIRFD